MILLVWIMVLLNLRTLIFRLLRIGGICNLHRRKYLHQSRNDKSEENNTSLSTIENLNNSNHTISEVYGSDEEFDNNTVSSESNEQTEQNNIENKLQESCHCIIICLMN